MTNAEKQDLKCSQNKSSSLFYVFEIKEGTEGKLRGGGKKQGGNWITG